MEIWNIVMPISEVNENTESEYVSKILNLFPKAVAVVVQSL